MNKIIKLIAVAVVALSIVTVSNAQQGGQYAATHVTNAQITALQGNIVKTNLVTYSAFTTAASRRYTIFTFQNVGTNPVVFAVASTSSTTFTNGATNAVYSAGGIRLAPSGTSGDRIILNETVPRNGPGNGGSASFVFQVAPGIDPGSVNLINVDAEGF